MQWQVFSNFSEEEYTVEGTLFDLSDLHSPGESIVYINP